MTLLELLPAPDNPFQRLSVLTTSDCPPGLSPLLYGHSSIFQSCHYPPFPSFRPRPLPTPGVVSSCSSSLSVWLLHSTAISRSVDSKFYEGRKPLCLVPLHSPQLQAEHPALSKHLITVWEGE